MRSIVCNLRSFKQATVLANKFSFIVTLRMTWLIRHGLDVMTLFI